MSKKIVKSYLNKISLKGGGGSGASGRRVEQSCQSGRVQDVLKLIYGL